MNPANKLTREATELMADIWAAVGILKSVGCCKKNVRVIYRIVGLNKVDGRFVLKKVMPQLKTLEPYPGHYPRYSFKSKEQGLHLDQEFIKQLIATGVMAPTDSISH